MDIDSAGKVQSHEGVDGFIGWFEDVDDALMGSNFEVFHGLFVDVRPSNGAKLSNFGGKWDGT